MEYAIRYLSPSGEVTLDTSENKDVFIEYDTLSGFVGQFEDTGIESVAMSGQRVDFRDRRVLPTEGSFTLVVKSRAAWVEARRAFSTREEGVLIIEGQSRCELPVTLAESLPAPPFIPEVGARVEVSLICRQGAWRMPTYSTGPRVEVTNFGESPVWPRIFWEGAGGKVTLPSGASFTLPSVASGRVLYLDRWRAGQVYDTDGVLDRDSTDLAGAVCEQTPPRATREYKIPAGARMEWDVEVFDPWI